MQQRSSPHDWTTLTDYKRIDKIIINLSSTSNYTSLSISDNGPGIKEPIFDKIFERFYSLRDEIDATKSHSGLGLNIARQIIDAHQGYISANNIIYQFQFLWTSIFNLLHSINIEFTWAVFLVKRFQAQLLGIS